VPGEDPSGAGDFLGLDAPLWADGIGEGGECRCVGDPGNDAGLAARERGVAGGLCGLCEGEGWDPDEPVWVGTQFVSDAVRGGRTCGGEGGAPDAAGDVGRVLREFCQCALGGVIAGVSGVVVEEGRGQRVPGGGGTWVVRVGDDAVAVFESALQRHVDGVGYFRSLVSLDGPGRAFPRVDHRALAGDGDAQSAPVGCGGSIAGGHGRARRLQDGAMGESGRPGGGDVAGGHGSVGLQRSAIRKSLDGEASQHPRHRNGDAVRWGFSGLGDAGWGRLGNRALQPDRGAGDRSGDRGVVAVQSTRCSGGGGDGDGRSWLPDAAAVFVRGELWVPICGLPGGLPGIGLALGRVAAGVVVPGPVGAAAVGFALVDGRRGRAGSGAGRDPVPDDGSAVQAVEGNEWRMGARAFARASVGPACPRGAGGLEA